MKILIDEIPTWRWLHIGKKKTNLGKRDGISRAQGKPSQGKSSSKKRNLSKFFKKNYAFFRVLTLFCVAGGIAGGTGFYLGSKLEVTFPSAIVVAISFVLVTRYTKIISWATGGWAIVILVVCLSFFSHDPFSYQKDTPKPFSFYSDATSVSWMTYDKANLLSAADATSDSVSLYFDCTSPQFQPVTRKAGFLWAVGGGNCGHVVKFDDKFLGNGTPDYLVTFPFEIDNLGQRCRALIDTRNLPSIKTVNGDLVGISTEDILRNEVELSDIFAGHFNDMKNSLIVQWSEAPVAGEFEFDSDRIFDKISCDEMSVNYYIYQDLLKSPSLIQNAPNSLYINLLIPNTYSIQVQDSEKYHISPVTYGEPWLQRFATVEGNLTQNGAFHVVIVDGNRHAIKELSFWLLGTVASPIILAIIIPLMLRKDKNK